MKFFVIAIACLVLLAVVFNLNATQTLDYTMAVFGEFADGVNSIKYMFLPDSFKGTIATSEQLGEYTVGNEQIPVIFYIKNHTDYNDDNTLYGNVWRVEVKTIVPSQGGNTVAIKYDRSNPWLIDKEHMATVFWCPYGLSYYSEDYEFVVDHGGMQTLYPTLSDLKNYTNSVTRFGAFLAVEENDTVGDFVRRELID